MNKTERTSYLKPDGRGTYNFICRGPCGINYIWEFLNKVMHEENFGPDTYRFNAAFIKYTKLFVDYLFTNGAAIKPDGNILTYNLVDLELPTELADELAQIGFVEINNRSHRYKKGYAIPGLSPGGSVHLISPFASIKLGYDLTRGNALSFGCMVGDEAKPLDSLLQALTNNGNLWRKENEKPDKTIQGSFSAEMLIKQALFDMSKKRIKLYNTR